MTIFKVDCSRFLKQTKSVEKLKKMGAKAKKALPENIIKRAIENESDSN